MSLVRVYFESVAAESTIEELGRAVIFQLEDLNEGVSPFQRAYAADVRRCDDIQRRLRFLFEEAEMDMDDEDLRRDVEHREEPVVFSRLEDLDAHLLAVEYSLKELNAHSKSMKEHYRELVELKMVLETCQEIFHESSRSVVPDLDQTHEKKTFAQKVKDFTSPEKSIARALEKEPTLYSGSHLLGFFAGVIDTKKKMSFERVLFRSIKGNHFVRSVDVDDGKSVFIIFMTGSSAKEKVSRICNAFGASRYPFPESAEEQEQR